MNKSNIKIIDIHSHLQFEEFETDREEIIKEMEKMGLATISVGTDFETSKDAVELSHRSSNLFSTIGVHPNHNEVFEESAFQDLLDERVVAVGECGIDLFRSEDTFDFQKENFVRQIEFALKNELPLMIHGRPSKNSMNAYELIIEILRGYPGVSGNIHFFVGSIDIARKFLDLGFTLSFDGPITFAPEYEEVIQFVPLDMIHAETDAPYASPVPFRGRRNSPLYVVYVIEAISRIKNVPLNELKSVLIQNAFRTFPKLKSALQ